MARSEELRKVEGSGEAVRYCMARAYVLDEGADVEDLAVSFYRFCYEVLGYVDMYEPFHMPICRFVVDPWRFKMLQACRGSFKSSIATYGYILWKMAQEYTVTGAVNKRYLIACENLTLALKFLRSVKQVCEKNRDYIEIFGNQVPTKASTNQWTDYKLTSAFKTDWRMAEPTVSPIAIDADRTGFHVDEVVCDDLETERNSASREQIDGCWSFYRLLHSIREPQDGRMMIVSTRWHYDDIYQRILDRNVKSPDIFKYKTLIKPAVEDSKLAFPTRYNEETLAELRLEQGSYIFSCQYLLDPVPESERKFKKGWMKYSRPQMFTQERLRTFTGCDFAFTEQRRIDTGEIVKADYTVILTVLVDEVWNFIIKDWFRERCSKLEGVAEMFRQCAAHGSMCAALQKYDRSQMGDIIEIYAHDNEYSRFAPRLEWISYPSSQKKEDRIETALQPLFESKRVFLLPNMDWFEQELLDFPRGAYDDGCDALCNIVKVSKPPPRTKMALYDNPILRRIRRLHKGLDPDPKKGKTWKNPMAA